MAQYYGFIPLYDMKHYVHFYKWYQSRHVSSLVEHNVKKIPGSLDCLKGVFQQVYYDGDFDWHHSSFMYKEATFPLIVVISSTFVVLLM